jgi:hypothetical protein
LSKDNFKEVCKRSIRNHAEFLWRRRVSIQPRLSYAFLPTSKLSMQPYLSFDVFRGRQLLTRLRLDDLDLGAAGINQYGSTQICPSCGNPEETRVHFLLECPSYQDLRASYSNRLPSLQSPLPTADRLRHLLLCGWSYTEDDARTIGNYVSDLWARRRVPGAFNPSAGSLHLPGV